VSLLHAESHPDHTVIITVSGVVAYQSPEQIRGAVRAAIVRWAPEVVLLDVADVSLMEVATIAALLASHQTGEWAGIPVALINVGVFPLSQLRERGLASLLCPHLSLPGDGVVAAWDAPPSPVAGHSQAPPAALLALNGGAQAVNG
jgi:anti-anti-sigma regulatory factor